MKAFAVQDDKVVVMDVLFLLDRELCRSGLRNQFGTQWVWFEDEVGTIYDPIRGPNPQFGPRAKPKGK